MENEALGKWKIFPWPGEESLTVAALPKSGKTIDGKEKSNGQDFKGNNLKNEFLLSAVSVGFLSSQNFKDKMEARMWMGKENLA